MKAGTSEIVTSDDVRALVMSKNAALAGIDDPICPPDVYAFMPGVNAGLLSGPDAAEACHGDSGGPLVVEQDGARVVVGVNAASRRVSPTSSEVLYECETRLDAASRDHVTDWLRGLGVVIAD